MKKLWPVVMGVLVLVGGLSPSAAQAQSNYTWMWDDFSQGFSADDPYSSPWFYAQLGSFVAADGNVTADGTDKLRVASSGANPYTGLPAFTLTLPQDSEAQSGVPAQLDHAKWVTYMNHPASSGLPGFDAVYGEELACQTWIGGQTHGTEFHPFGIEVQDPQDDVRLATFGQATFDFETGMAFDFLFTNNTVYAVYERSALLRPFLGNYAAFLYAIPVKQRPYLGSWHHTKILYDRSAGIVRWILDGEQVFQVTQVGRHIDRQWMYIDHGGWEQDVDMRQLSCGMGMFTLLDAHKSPGYVSWQGGLVRLADWSTPYIYPATGQYSYWFWDEYSQYQHRLFGQGAEMRVWEYWVSSTPRTHSITGVVGVAGSDMWNANRLVPGGCSGTAFSTPDPAGPNTSVANSWGDVSWDCASGLFHTGPQPWARTSPPTENPSFTFTPPAGYTCDGYQLWGPRTNESFSKWGNSCTLSFNLREAGDIFVYFYVRPTLAYHIAGAASIDGSDHSGPNRLTQGPCPGTPFITAADLGGTTTVSHAQLNEANWNCSSPEFWYGEYVWQKTSIEAGQQSFTYTPPPGYACVWFWGYGDRTAEWFSTSGNSCTVTAQLENPQGWLYLWFLVQPT
jgi:hypothetical protein